MKMKISVRDNCKYRMFMHSAGKSWGMINDVNKSHAQEISDTLLYFNSNIFNINFIFYYSIHFFQSSHFIIINASPKMFKYLII